MLVFSQVTRSLLTEIRNLAILNHSLLMFCTLYLYIQATLFFFSMDSYLFNVYHILLTF
jgi:hypothetical protein